jgi:hypothetical protein
MAEAHSRAEESARGAKGYAFDRGCRVPSQVRVLPLPPGRWCSDPCCRIVEREAASGRKRRRRLQGIEGARAAIPTGVRPGSAFVAGHAGCR